MKRFCIAVLALGLLSAGCDKNTTPSPDNSTTQPPAVTATHPFEDALIAGGFSVRDTKISNDNTATVEPQDGSKCTVVLEASYPSLDTYRVTKVGGTPFNQLPSALQSTLGVDNVKEETLWRAITAARRVKTLHC